MSAIAWITAGVTSAADRCSLSEHVTLLELPTPLMQTLGEATGRKSNTSPSCSKDFRVEAALAVGDKFEHRSYRIICQRWSTMGGEPQQVSVVTESCNILELFIIQLLRRAVDARARAAW